MCAESVTHPHLPRSYCVQEIVFVEEGFGVGIYGVCGRASTPDAIASGASDMCKEAKHAKRTDSRLILVNSKFYKVCDLIHGLLAM
jgi:hypothetical protein